MYNYTQSINPKLRILRKNRHRILHVSHFNTILRLIRSLCMYNCFHFGRIVHKSHHASSRLRQECVYVVLYVILYQARLTAHVCTKIGAQVVHVTHDSSLKPPKGSAKW